MKSICFIANKYPNEVDPNGLIFVQQLVWSIADSGKNCIVICPLALNLNIRYAKIPEHIRETTENGYVIDVYFPKFFGLGQSHYVFGKSPAPLTTTLFTKAILQVIRRYNLHFDVVYGHFVTPAGIAAARIGRQFHISSFIAHGESTTWSIDQFGADRVKRELESLSGVIAVSSRNRDLLIEAGIVPKEKIKVFPNGYRPERFYKIDKSTARKKLGWTDDMFVVGLVGSFDDRKGILRLEKAVDSLENVYFACAGKGKLVPTSSKCLLAEPIKNADLSIFYSALDVFVLPTLNEGCCNAIIEAMACGCPIISSDLPFNDDILDDCCSIRINPNDPVEIAEAISKLYNCSKKKEQMSIDSRNKAKEFTLDERAKSILKYMENMTYGDMNLI